MKKLKVVLFAAVSFLLTFSATAAVLNVGNSTWGYVNVYSGNGPGMAGIFTPNDGYRRMRFFNNTSYNINCKAQNVYGEWVFSGTLRPHAWQDVGIGNASGSWGCWTL